MSHSAHGHRYSKARYKNRNLPEDKEFWVEHLDALLVPRFSRSQHRRTLRMDTTAQLN